MSNSHSSNSSFESSAGKPSDDLNAGFGSRQTDADKAAAEALAELAKAQKEQKDQRDKRGRAEHRDDEQEAQKIEAAEVKAKLLAQREVPVMKGQPRGSAQPGDPPTVAEKIEQNGIITPNDSERNFFDSSDNKGKPQELYVNYAKQIMANVKEKQDEYVNAYVKILKGEYKVEQEKIIDTTKKGDQALSSKELETLTGALTLRSLNTPDQNDVFASVRKTLVVNNEQEQTDYKERLAGSIENIRQAFIKNAATQLGDVSAADKTAYVERQMRGLYAFCDSISVKHASRANIDNQADREVRMGDRVQFNGSDAYSGLERELLAAQRLLASGQSDNAKALLTNLSSGQNLPAGVHRLSFGKSLLEDGKITMNDATLAVELNRKIEALRAALKPGRVNTGAGVGIVNDDLLSIEEKDQRYQEDRRNEPISIEEFAYQQQILQWVKEPSAHNWLHALNNPAVTDKEEALRKEIANSIYGLADGYSKSRNLGLVPNEARIKELVDKLNVQSMIDFAKKKGGSAAIQDAPSPVSSQVSASTTAEVLMAHIALINASNEAPPAAAVSDTSSQTNSDSRLAAGLSNTSPTSIAGYRSDVGDPNVFWQGDRKFRFRPVSYTQSISPDTVTSPGSVTPTVNPSVSGGAAQNYTFIPQSQPQPYYAQQSYAQPGGFMQPGYMQPGYMPGYYGGNNNGGFMPGMLNAAGTGMMMAGDMNLLRNFNNPNPQTRNAALLEMMAGQAMMGGGGMYGMPYGYGGMPYGYGGMPYGYGGMPYGYGGMPYGYGGMPYGYGGMPYGYGGGMGGGGCGGGGLGGGMLGGLGVGMLGSMLGYGLLGGLGGFGGMGGGYGGYGGYSPYGGYGGGIPGNGMPMPYGANSGNGLVVPPNYGNGGYGNMSGGGAGGGMMGGGMPGGNGGIGGGSGIAHGGGAYGGHNGLLHNGNGQIHHPTPHPTPHPNPVHPTPHPNPVHPFRIHPNIGGHGGRRASYIPNATRSSSPETRQSVASYKPVKDNSSSGSRVSAGVRSLAGFFPHFRSTLPAAPLYSVYGALASGSSGFLTGFRGGINVGHYGFTLADRNTGSLINNRIFGDGKNNNFIFNG